MAEEPLTEILLRLGWAARTATGCKANPLIRRMGWVREHTIIEDAGEYVKTITVVTPTRKGLLHMGF